MIITQSFYSFHHYNQLCTIISAGIKRPVTQEDKEWIRASLSKLGRFTGMAWILSPEPPQVRFLLWYFHVPLKLAETSQLHYIKSMAIWLGF